jgi:hypothetical protein
MAANKYLAVVTGKVKEIFATIISTGVTEANKIVALGADGLLDVSVMPVGIAAELTVCPCTEDLTAGDFVNLYLSGGVIKARKADATNNSKPAHGFVLANVVNGNNASVYRVSQTNTALAGLTIGSDYWLHTTPGAITTVPPGAAGNIVQYIGRAGSATAIVFSNETYVEIA